MDVRERLASVKEGTLVLLSEQETPAHLGRPVIGFFHEVKNATSLFHSGPTPAVYLHSPAWFLNRTNLFVRRPGPQALWWPCLDVVPTDCLDAARCVYADAEFFLSRFHLCAVGEHEIGGLLRQEGFYAPLATYFERG